MMKDTRYLLVVINIHRSIVRLSGDFCFGMQCGGLFMTINKIMANNCQMKGKPMQRQQANDTHVDGFAATVFLLVSLGGILMLERGCRREIVMSSEKYK
jgi:hypothetical protein